MSNKSEKLVIIGEGEFARIAYEYFTIDSAYDVVAFSAEQKFIKERELYGLPVVPFETIESTYSPKEYKVFTAITYTQLNRVRSRLYNAAKSKGYSFANYVSSKAFVAPSAEIGENTFIFENNVIQSFSHVGNNVILWSGNHIGHSSRINDNCYLSSHVVVAGYCEIEKNCFLGINSTIADNIQIAPDCFIGAGAVVLRGTEAGRIYQGNPAQAAKVSSYRFFKIEEPSFAS